MESIDFIVISGLAVVALVYWGVNQLRRKGGHFNLSPVPTIHQEVLIPEDFFTFEKKVELRVPEAPETILVQLRPNMRGKVVRLRNALKGGSTHLFLRLLVNESASVETNAEDEDLLNHLRTIVLGDELKVERLIEAERRQFPQLDRAAWVRAAVERWQWDNR